MNLMSIVLLGYRPGELPPEQLRMIQDIVPDMQLLLTEDRREIESVLDEIEIAMRRFPHDLLAKAKNLRWFQQWGAGADWLLRYPGVAELSFVLTNASGVHPIQITEHIIGLLLAFARQLHRAVRLQGKHQWHRPEQDALFELAGKTLLIVGVGAIGERTAKVARAFGMRVLGIRNNPALQVPGVEMMYGPAQLLDVLPEADFLVVTAPLTRNTRGMVGEQELRAAKPTAYVFNIGRGGTIQEKALIQALQNGWIAGAGLDVFESEPLPEDSPLWDMENVIVTAHYAGLTPQYEARAIEIFIDNLRRYREGKPLKNVVDKKLGY
jgi:phosphoglycerate dehydrogenase-like enzyme